MSTCDRPRDDEPESLEYSAKLLALSLPDELLESLRQDWGNTNVAVIKHWRDRVRGWVMPHEARARE